MPCGNGFGYTGTGQHVGQQQVRQEETPMNMLEYFKNWTDVVEFPKKAELFHEMDEADYMYVILSGEVEVTLRGEPLGAELEGGIVGEMAMINNATRSATAVALTKVKAARVNRDQFKRIIVDNPDFALHLMQVMANRLRVADQVIVG
jgi:CRP/FNR family cyclic AMP-dependent transcriptional regulator